MSNPVNKPEPLSRQGETCFLNSEMPKTFHACPSINKSIERHPRGPSYSPPLFPTIANQCSLHYNLSPQVGLLGMRRKLRCTFFGSESFAWYIQLDVSYAISYIFRSDGYKK